MSKRKDEPDIEDDGRVVASMNVDGMPWYIEQGQRREASGETGRASQMTREEGRAYTWGVLKAGFLVAAVFAGGYFLFLLFCVKVWFA